MRNAPGQAVNLQATSGRKGHEFCDVWVQKIHFPALVFLTPAFRAMQPSVTSTVFCPSGIPPSVALQHFTNTAKFHSICVGQADLTYISQVGKLSKVKQLVDTITGNRRALAHSVPILSPVAYP